MQLLSELNDLLSSDVSENYWSDELVLRAREVVERLTETDWATLEANWQRRPAQWQHRFADVISRGSAAKTVPLLNTMIECDDDKLSLIAADSLNALIFDGHVISLTAKARSRLDFLSKISKLNKLVIDTLLGHLAHDPQKF